MSFRRQDVLSIIKTAVGCALFGVGFNLFLLPNELNAGGISGLAMLFVHWIGVGTVGTVTALINIPLFAIAGIKIGKRFFFASLIGMMFSSIFIDIFSLLPIPETEPLIGALYGGACCGMGLGLVFGTGGSTGGSDIVVRYIKKCNPNLQIGFISTCFDLIVVILTGIAFQDSGRALYSGVAIFVCGRVIDAVVYQFDYSRVVLIVSNHYNDVADAIARDLNRGVTFLQGEGYYAHTATKVILTAVKRQQLAELKSLVVSVDPKSFIIVQEAHQVLGDGFVRYSKDML